MRTCDGCRLCCKLIAVTEFSKPQGEWCMYCNSVGCEIFDNPTRPPDCGSFLCLWLRDESIPEDMRPDRIHAVFDLRPGETIIHVHLDERTPDSYRRGRLHRWIEEKRAAGIDVTLVAGPRRKLLSNYREDSPFTILRDK